MYPLAVAALQRLGPGLWAGTRSLSSLASSAAAKPFEFNEQRRYYVQPASKPSEPGDAATASPSVAPQQQQQRVRVLPLKRRIIDPAQDIPEVCP
jgi:hypothetical protein